MCVIKAFRVLAIYCLTYLISIVNVMDHCDVLWDDQAGQLSLDYTMMKGRRLNIALRQN